MRIINRIFALIHITLRYCIYSSQGNYRNISSLILTLPYLIRVAHLKLVCMKIKVFNLCQDINDRDLERLFNPFGVVNSAVVSRNILNSRSNCNGIVEMPVDKQGEQAILSLNKTLVSGKIITVSKLDSD